MGRIIAFVYGLLAYVVFLGSFLYGIGFVTGLWVPKTIDNGTDTSVTAALVIDLLLMSVFAIQHSVMARPAFKKWWTQFVPAAVERSTYVLLASLALILLYWQWRPIPALVWQIGNPQFAEVVLAVSLLGWLVVLVSTFLINHFELFGLQQIFANLTGRKVPEPRFRTPLFYKFVRHPIYLGFIIAFWATPTMTAGHLLFAFVTTAYMVVAISLEERDLIDYFGDDYRNYRQRVSALIPFWRKM